MFTIWSIVTACTHLESSRSDWPNWSFITLINKKYILSQKVKCLFILFFIFKQKELQYSSYVKQWSKQTEKHRNGELKQVKDFSVFV